MSYGHEAQLSLAAMPYDLLVPYEGKILKVQVKTVSKSGGFNADYATFNTCKHRYEEGKRSRVAYGSDQFDLFALVFLPMEKVIFSADLFGQTSYTLSVADIEEVDEKESWDKAVKTAMERRDGRR